MGSTSERLQSVLFYHFHPTVFSTDQAFYYPLTEHCFTCRKTYCGLSLAWWRPAGTHTSFLKPAAGAVFCLWMRRTGTTQFLSSSNITTRRICEKCELLTINQGDEDELVRLGEERTDFDFNVFRCSIHTLSCLVTYFCIEKCIKHFSSDKPLNLTVL